MELHGYKEKVNKRDVGLSMKICFHIEKNIKLAWLYCLQFIFRHNSLFK